MTLPIHHWESLSATEQTELLRRPAASQSDAVTEAAAAIVARVRQGGDDALRELTKRFDNVEIAAIEVDQQEKLTALAALSSAAKGAIDTAINNVRAFHEAQLPRSIRVETVPGVVCERVSQPIDSIGLYVPAGTAPLPSAAIMLAVPAVIARCPVAVLCTPPRPDGSVDPAVLVAAASAGIDTVFKVGGAQAIAALAYGTATIPKVSKIFGPGNAYVTAAKSLVSTDPMGAAIDMPAGPSEVLVIADDSADPEFVAADLLSQAEHGVDSQVLLLTSSAFIAKKVAAAVQQQLETLSRRQIASEALANSRLIVTRNIDGAIQISNRYAPEHLILQVTNAEQLLTDVRNAGSVFVGPWTPESLGDYCSGTNHVLPTFGYATTYSGLGVEQFCRSMTVQTASREGLDRLADTAVTLAQLEGLDAHAAAVTRRLEARR